MKRIAVLSALILTVAVVLTACKTSAPTYTETAQMTGTAASQALAQPSGQAEDGSQTQDGTDTLLASDRVSANAENAGALTAVTSGSSEEATVSGTKDDATAVGTTQKASSSAAPQKSSSSDSTQKATSSAATRKASAGLTDKTTASTTKSGGSSQTSAANPSGTPHVSVPSEGTTASTTSTTKPVADSGAVSGTISYLNNAAVTYLPALNADDLKAFGITGDKQKEILKNKKDWAAYTIQIDFRNNTDKPLTLYYLDVTDNGKDDIYICGDTAGELGMSAGGKISEKFYVLAKKDYADIDVRDKLSHMAMRIQYAETPADDTMTPIFKYSKIG